MLYFKACPKCKGDMVTEKDPYGNYRRCLHCGLYQDEMAAAGEKAA